MLPPPVLVEILPPLELLIKRPDGVPPGMTFEVEVPVIEMVPPPVVDQALEKIEIPFEEPV